MARRSSQPGPTVHCCTATSKAFERYDVDSLVALLHEDATLSMPPF